MNSRSCKQCLRDEAIALQLQKVHLIRRTQGAGISRLSWLLLLLVVLISLWGCGPEIKPKPGFVLLEPEAVKKIIQDIDITRQGLASWQDLAGPLTRNLDYVQSRPPEQEAISAYETSVSWEKIQATLERLLALLPRIERQPELLSQHFVWYELYPPSLLTGYYEPLVPASLQPDPDYPYPLYSLPQDLQVADLGDFHPRWRDQRLIYRIQDKRIVPYPDRKAIEAEGAIEDTAEIVAWAKDLVDVFFLQIQGSGRLLLPDGSIQPIGYAGKNGRPYTSLGRHMAKLGLLEPGRVSMRSIRTYLKDHPQLLPEILYSNPSYVFFRLRQGGPYGAMGRELTPLLSLAVDPKLLPLGAFLLLRSDLPDPGRNDTIPLCGPGLAQDTGGAISKHHLDLFCGFGKEAGALAGGLKAKARVYLLLAK